MAKLDKNNINDLLKSKDPDIIFNTLPFNVLIENQEDIKNTLKIEGLSNRNKKAYSDSEYIIRLDVEIRERFIPEILNDIKDVLDLDYTEFDTIDNLKRHIGNIHDILEQNTILQSYKSYVVINNREKPDSTKLQELLTSVQITKVKVNSTAGEDNNCSIFAFLMATFPPFTGYSYLNQICIAKIFRKYALPKIIKNYDASKNTKDKINSLKKEINTNSIIDYIIFKILSKTYNIVCFLYDDNADNVYYYDTKNEDDNGILIYFKGAHYSNVELNDKSLFSKEIVKKLKPFSTLLNYSNSNNANAGLHSSNKNVMQHPLISNAIKEAVITQNNLNAALRGSKVTPLENNAAKEANNAKRTLELVQNNIFIDAAFKGDIYAIEYFIKKGVDVNTQNEHGITALMLAAAGGHLEIVTTLLETPGIDVNKTNIDGFTALMIAAAESQIPVIAALLKSPDIDMNVESLSTNNTWNKKTALTLLNKDLLEQLEKIMIINGDYKIFEKFAGSWRRNGEISRIFRLPNRDLNLLHPKKKERILNMRHQLRFGGPGRYLNFNKYRKNDGSLNFKPMRRTWKNWRKNTWNALTRRRARVHPI